MIFITLLFLFYNIIIYYIIIIIFTFKQIPNFKRTQYTISIYQRMTSNRLRLIISVWDNFNIARYI